MEQKKQTNKLIAIPFLLLHIAVAIVTWRDIGERSDRQVRGPKAVWRAASAINTIGSLAYWLFGRLPGRR